jgi:hypothetical protein
MKQTLKKYGAVFLMVCILFNCEKYKNETGNQIVKPLMAQEDFIRQYQKWLDVNDFEKAAENATREEKLRLENLKKFVFKTQETLDSSLLQTTVLDVNCLPKDEHTICACRMKDQFEVYDITFYLKKLNNRWLMDAPPEEAQIYQDEELQKIIDSIFQTMENKFQQ